LIKFAEQPSFLRNLLMNFKPLFVLLLIFTFVSCDNEPIEGEFVVDDPSLLTPSFKAELEDFTFEATVFSAETLQGITTITGIRPNGDIITLKLNGAGTGSSDMVTQGSATFGIDLDPFAFNSNNLGGSGLVTVSEYSVALAIISGTFSFTATRPQLDANGQPILDGNGNSLYDEVVVTE